MFRLSTSLLLRIASRKTKHAAERYDRYRVNMVPHEKTD